MRELGIDGRIILKYKRDRNLMLNKYELDGRWDVHKNLVGTSEGEKETTLEILA
jgi:hypothetical protein